MYKIFLVDDNPYMLRELEDLLDWENLDIEIVGMFPNGYDTLDELRKVIPDIILADILMPGMSGIELAALVHKEYPSIKIVFMSSYSEFEFAKKAIDLGIYGYVIKPIGTSTLISVLNKVITELERERIDQVERENMANQMNNMLPVVREQFCRDMILFDLSESLLLDRMSYINIILPKHPYIFVAVINIKAEKDSIEHTKDYHLQSIKIHSAIQSFQEEGRTLQTIQMSESEYAIIIILDGDIYDNVVESITTLLSRISIDVDCKLKLSSIIGISNCSYELTDISVLYQQAKTAIEAAFNEGSNPVIRYDEIKLEETATDHNENEYSLVKELFTIGDEDDVHSFVQDNFHNIPLSQQNVKNRVFAIMNNASVIIVESGYSMKDIFGDDVSIWQKLSKYDSIVDISQWVFNVLRFIQVFLMEHRTEHERKYSRHIENIKDFVHEHYQEQITVQDIAKSVFLAPNYASRKFQREMKMTIFDYLQNYRMNQAKKLLQDPNNRVADVADQVGYISKTNFCLTFKRHTGLSPTEYRKQENPK